MIRINAQYTDYYIGTDPAYPGGKAIDTTDGDTEDGTPYKADWMNDINGFRQAAIVEAHGTFQVSGMPDHAGKSDTLDALKIITDNIISGKVTSEYILEKLLQIDGEGSGLDADLFQGQPPEYYLAASFAGFFVRTIMGIETVIPWGEFNRDYNPDTDYIVFISAHGPYKEFVSFPCDVQADGLHVYPQRLIDGNLVGGTREVTWGSFTWGDGTMWGASEPMKINIQIKEA